jgi:hypothetical protein
MRQIQAPSMSFKGKIKEYSQMDLYGNVNEIVVPMTERELPENLREFIERDPSFTPEIYSQNLMNILIQKDTLASTDQSRSLLTLETLSKMENF